MSNRIVHYIILIGTPGIFLLHCLVVRDVINGTITWPKSLFVISMSVGWLAVFSFYRRNRS